MMYRNSAYCAVAALLLAWASALQAQITIGNEDDSSVFGPTDQSGTLSYNNDGDFLLVSVHAGGDKELLSPFTPPTVTYNGVALQLLDAQMSDSRRALGVYYLAAPDAGTFDIAVDWGGDIAADGGDLDEDAEGNWQFSALSLSNVDDAHPVASLAYLPNAPKIPGTPWPVTMLSDYEVDASISVGDLFLYAHSLDGTALNPNYTVPTDSQTVHLETTLSSPARDVELTSAVLVAGDISGDNSDELIVTQQARRSGYRLGVVLNATTGGGPAVLLGDANNDGVVSADDFAAVQTNFGNTGAADGLLPGDANDDGVVSADDFAAIQTNFGNVLGAAAEANPIPEPATLALLAMGGLAMLRRRR